jgi:uncharacterized protein (DUF362 family)
MKYLQKSPSFNRRQFLEMVGLSGLSAFLTACGLLRQSSSTSTPKNPTLTTSPTLAPSVTSEPILTVQPADHPAYKALAAISQAENYDPIILHNRLEKMLADLGGLADLVRPGAHMGVKVNLTGGTFWDADLPLPATEYFATHPALVGELVKLLFAAGAGKVTIMDGLGDENNFSAWGYTEMARSVGADLVDLCKPDPYPDFRTFPVGPKFNIYEAFYLNPILKDIDVFISVAKMKVHYTAGVTLSMKNLFGIAPIKYYKRHESDNNRSAFHDDSESIDRRVPRVIVDLNMARPIDLAIIDGIMTCESGAGPWDQGLSPVRPGLLVASRDPLAADAVATALMGFDPNGAPGTTPYTRGDNHLALAYQAGLGTIDLAEIGILGPPIEQVRFPFRPVG